MSIANPMIMEFVRMNSLHVPPPHPPLITVLSFNDWADILWAASNDGASFLEVSKNLVLNAKQVLENDLLTEASVRDSMAMKEKVFVDLWNAESQFHSDLVQMDSGGLRLSEPDSDDDDGLILTEEERNFHARYVSESNAQMAAGMAKDKSREVNKFFRNAFLPIAPARRIQSEARSKGDKAWDFETFNHEAPISVSAYRLLASLTEVEMDRCYDKALLENTELVKGPYHRTSDTMKLPVVGHFDLLKCSITSSQLAIRGFFPPKVQTPLVELKRIWNVGRPYLKCRCLESGTESPYEERSCRRVRSLEAERLSGCSGIPRFQLRGDGGFRRGVRDDSVLLARRGFTTAFGNRGRPHIVRKYCVGRPFHWPSSPGLIPPALGGALEIVDLVNSRTFIPTPAIKLATDFARRQVRNQLSTLGLKRHSDPPSPLNVHA
ncbi:hypothetical protein CBR_g60254, partial [Chara braunii]